MSGLCMYIRMWLFIYGISKMTLIQLHFVKIKQSFLLCLLFFLILKYSNIYHLYDWTTTSTRFFIHQKDSSYNYSKHIACIFLRQSSTFHIFFSFSQTNHFLCLLSTYFTLRISSSLFKSLSNPTSVLGVCEQYQHISSDRLLLTFSSYFFYYELQKQPILYIL